MASTIWRGYITFGLISVPVRLFRAARAERVSLRRLYRHEPSSGPQPTAWPADFESEPEPPTSRKAGSVAEAPKPMLVQASRAPVQQQSEPILEPVRQASIRRASEEVLPEESVVKGFEFEKGRYVALDKEELKSIAPKTATEMQIEEFVSLADIDPVYFETSYYVVPEQAGEKAYALLYKAFQTSGLVAIAQFAMHSREHVVVLRPGKTGIIAHTMFYSSEVRGDEEYRAETSSVTARELQLAETLVKSLAGPYEPEKYRDSYREKLEALIAQKVAGKPVAGPEKTVRASTVVDITQALERSLAALKKPAASEQPKKTEAAKQASGGRKKAGRKGAGG
ncbi:MAG: Ku protein [Acidobacteriaceae bacterium]|nr:Ku protein [Acidobacteriaceae bacterium]